MDHGKRAGPGVFLCGGDSNEGWPGAYRRRLGEEDSSRRSRHGRKHSRVGIPFSPGLRRDGNTGMSRGETSRHGKCRVCPLPNLPKKILHFNPAVAQRSFQRVAIHLRMKRKHNPSSVRVLHLDVAALAMDFEKTQPLQCGQYLPARQQRQLHIVNSTTSRSLFAVNSDGDGSKYKSMASRIFFNASSRDLPCDQQLFRAGQCATNQPSSPGSITIFRFTREISSFGPKFSSGERKNITNESEWSERQDLNLPPPADNQGVTTRDSQGDSQTPVTSLHDLSQVVIAWPRLNPALKAAILAILQSTNDAGGVA